MELDDYYDYLIGMVNPEQTHTKLLSVMFETPFETINPRDTNRKDDGCALRSEWEECNRVFIEDIDISILEVVISMAIRIEFLADIGDTKYWFWRLIENLLLGKYSDASLSPFDEKEIHMVLNRFNRRRYRPDGWGGMFPLMHPKQDQRYVELWYQMQEWVSENC